MTESGNVEASISALILSIGSSAAMALGLAPNPQTNSIEKDINVAKFNIDLLMEIKKKTAGNLTSDEDKLLSSLVQDLQVKYVQERNT